jgi:5-methylcytosine-specific restriction endonuclease McrA
MAFTDEQKIAAWEKAHKIPGYNEAMFRKDACGAWIMRDKYGSQDNTFGWVIDHIYPKSLGGKDDNDNLRALHYQNNLSKGDDYPSYTTAVTSDGDKNIPSKRNITVNEKTRNKLNALYHL